MSGIIVTGGGSHLANLQIAIQKKTGIDKFRHATYIIPSVESVTPELLARNSRQCTLLGLLSSAREYCHEQEVPRDLFDITEPTEDEDAIRQAQAEELERQKAEAARLAKEAEEERAAEAARLAQEKAQQEAAIRKAEEERLEAERQARAEEERRLRKEKSLFGRLQKLGQRLAREIIDGEE